MAVLRTGQSKVQSPFAAGERAITRRIRAEQSAAIEQGRRERAAFDERLRQRKAERRREEEIRRKAGLAEQDAQMRSDLIQTLARGKGQGIFGAKLPRINKFILHAGEEDKDPATGKIVRKNVLDFDAEIDPGHIEKLRTLSSLVRDNQAARALEFHRTGKLPPKQEKALSDLASDDFPTISRQMAPQEGGAEPDIPMPDPITPQQPLVPGTPPVSQQAGPLAPGDIDLTQLLQQGIVGPPQGATPESFQPGFEQGFQGIDQPAAPIENIHELIQSGVIPGTKAAKPQRNPTQEKIDAFISTMTAMGHDVTPEQIQRMVGAAEKGPDLLKQTMIDFFRERSGLDPITTGPKEAVAATPKKGAAKKVAGKGKGAARPQITTQFINDAKRQFLDANPDRTIRDVVIRGDQVILIDDEGFENVATPKAGS